MFEKRDEYVKWAMRNRAEDFEASMRGDNARRKVAVQEYEDAWRAAHSALARRWELKLELEARVARFREEQKRDLLRPVTDFIAGAQSEAAFEAGIGIEPGAENVSEALSISVAEARKFMRLIEGRSEEGVF